MAGHTVLDIGFIASFVNIKMVRGSLLTIYRRSLDPGRRLLTAENSGCLAVALILCKNSEVGGAIANKANDKHTEIEVIVLGTPKDSGNVNSEKYENLTHIQI